MMKPNYTQDADWTLKILFGSPLAESRTFDSTLMVQLQWKGGASLTFKGWTYCQTQMAQEDCGRTHAVVLHQKHNSSKFRIAVV